MKKRDLELHDQTGSAEAAAVLAGLKDFNRQFGSAEWRELTIYSRDLHGHVDAGLNGFTSWGWLFVKLLWVSEPLRGMGMGSRLLAAAEAEARTRGCRGVWLDTFGFQARGFYEKRGYRLFGELGDFPAGYSRFFLEKRL